MNQLTTIDPREPAPRVPPHSIEAEQELLGAILVNNQALDKVAGFLREEHFANRLHGRLYAALAKLIDAGAAVSPTTLAPFFGGDVQLKEIGGGEYLGRLMGSVTTIINANQYGQMIRDMALRRGVIAIGEDAVNAAYNPDVDLPVGALIESVYDALDRVGENDRGAGAGFQPIARGVDLALEAAQAASLRDGKLAGITTGLKDLDAKTGGLHRGEYIILAGRPSMGKTAAAVAIMLNAAKAQEAGAFFSLEMKAQDVAIRPLADLTGIHYSSIRAGQFNDHDMTRMVAVRGDLAQLPLWIDDLSSRTMGSIRSAVRAHKRRLDKRGIDLAVVGIDYLQLIRGSGNHRGNRVQEIGEISRDLKRLAKDMDVALLVLSQLNRGVESRPDKRPMMSDLREAGDIEQDADVVIMVYREEYYLARAEPPEDDPQKPAWRLKLDAAKNLCQLLIEKQRQGPAPKQVNLFFDPGLSRFRNFDWMQQGEFL